MNLSVDKNNKRGFGLLEVLVSSSIIILVLGSVVFIGRQALANSTYSQQRAEAIFLAQEGLESVRQIRDTNWIDRDNRTEWDDLAAYGTHFTSLLASPGDYVLKYSDTQKRFMLEEDSSQEEKTITVDKQAFVRTISVSTVDSESSMLPGTEGNDIYKDINALKVTVRIDWKFGGVDRTTNVSEILTNWRPNF